jgi:hypothetical protein
MPVRLDAVRHASCVAFCRPCRAFPPSTRAAPSPGRPLFVVMLFRGLGHIAMYEVHTAQMSEERPDTLQLYGQDECPNGGISASSVSSSEFGIADAGFASDGFWNRYDHTPFQSRFIHALVTGTAP